MSDEEFLERASVDEEEEDDDENEEDQEQGCGGTEDGVQPLRKKEGNFDFEQKKFPV